MGRTKYYHVDEVAELIGVSANEVRDMLKRKEFNHISIALFVPS